MGDREERCSPWNVHRIRCVCGCVFVYVCVCCWGGGPATGSVPSQPDSLSQSATHGARFRRGGANTHSHTHTHACMKSCTHAHTKSWLPPTKRVNPYWVLRLVSRMNRWSHKTWASISS